MPDTPAVIVPREMTDEMVAEGVNAFTNIRDIHEAVIAASPNAGCVSAEQVRNLAAAIKKASSECRYCKYDYSMYPGDEPPFVIRDEKTNEIVFRSRDYDEAERTYIRMCEDHVALAALASLGLEVG